MAEVSETVGLSEAWLAAKADLAEVAGDRGRCRTFWSDRYREDVPALLAEVRRLRAENDRLRFYGDNAPALVEERDATIARLRKELRVLNQQREAHQRRMGEML